MLTREDDVDAHALHRRGWTISAIARHLGHDRKTIRAYLPGGRVAGQRQRGPSRTRSSRSPATAGNGWPRTRTCGRPRCSTSSLELGYDRSYPTFTRQLRARGLRPACEPCRPAKGRPVAVIEHPPGEETQFDWLELPDPPAQWGWGSKAFLLVGALAHSGRWRGVLAESTDQPHLIDALHRISGALGGLTRTLAVRPDGHRLPPRQSGRVTGLVRRGRQALRGGGGDLPAPAREPQGRGGEGQPHRRATLVAHPARRGHPRAGPGVAGPVVRAARRHPAAPDRRRARPRVATVAAAEPLRRCRRRSRPSVTVAADGLGAGAGRLPRQLATRCHPSWPAPRSPSPTGSAPPTSSCRHRAAGIVIARHRLAAGRGRGHRPRHRSRPGPGARRDGRVHRRRAAPAQAAHPTRPGRPRRRRTRCAPDHAHRPPPSTPDTATGTGGEVVVDLARYAAAAHGRNTLR